MVASAFLILHCRTSHPFSLCQGLRGKPRHHLITVWVPPCKGITTLVGRRSQWIFQRVPQLRCLKSRVGKLCRWLARHQTNQPSRVLCGKQLPLELFHPACLVLVRPRCCEIYVLSIYLFFSRKMALSLLNDCQHIRMSFGALSACGWSLHHCTHRHCIHSYLHGVLFSLDSCVLTKFISCGALCLLGTLQPVSPYSRVM